MPEDLKHDESLEPADVRSHRGAETGRPPPKHTLWLVLLLAAWAGVVYLFFTRPEESVETPSDPVPAVTPTQTPPEAPAVEETPVPRAPPTSTPVPERRIRIVSDPSGTTVLRNGVFVGVTPFELINPRSGDLLRFQKNGFEPKRVEWEMAPEGETFEVELEPLPGEIRLTLVPAEASLSVDGERVDLPEDGLLGLSLSTHVLRAEAPGYEAKEIRVAPAKAYVREVRLELTPETPPTPEPTPGIEPESVEGPVRTSLGQVMIRPGLPMTVRLGSVRGTSGRRSNEPLRQVRLVRPFRISREEVSNAQFRSFRADHDSGHWKGVGLNGETQPVVRVRWEDAVAFCNWLSEKEGLPPAYIEEDGGWRFEPDPGTGYRLPTEAEWEAMARSGEEGSRFPWGDTVPPEVAGVNLSGEESKGKVVPVLEGYRDPFVGPAPVGEVWEHPSGLRGLGGNVSEWMHDTYGIPEEGGAPETDPKGPDRGGFHVIKGPNWQTAGLVDLRTASRRYDREGSPVVGFRVARYVEPPASGE